MRHAIAAMAHDGNDLIVDEVMFSRDAAQNIANFLAQHEVHFVGLFAVLQRAGGEGASARGSIFSIVFGEGGNITASIVALPTLTADSTLPILHHRHAVDAIRIPRTTFKI